MISKQISIPITCLWLRRLLVTGFGILTGLWLNRDKKNVHEKKLLYAPSSFGRFIANDEANAV